MPTPVGGGGRLRGYAREERERENDEVASARESLTLVSRRAEALPLFDGSSSCSPSSLLILSLPITHPLSLQIHRLAEALEDDGGAGGQGGGQANDGYDDDGKGGVSFFCLIC